MKGGALKKVQISFNRLYSQKRVNSRCDQTSAIRNSPAQAQLSLHVYAEKGDFPADVGDYQRFIPEKYAPHIGTIHLRRSIMDMPGKR
jgi:hypothetical protein